MKLESCTTVNWARDDRQNTMFNFRRHKFSSDSPSPWSWTSGSTRLGGRQERDV